MLLLIVSVFLVELERLREQLVSEIRSNQHLEGDLNQMDIKIGLLVRNRITLQVISLHPLPSSLSCKAKRQCLLTLQTSNEVSVCHLII